MSQRYNVSGSGRIELPLILTPNPYSWSEQVLVVIMIQDHPLDINYVNLNYTISSLDGGSIFTGPAISSGWPRGGSGIIAEPDLNGTEYYEWTIDYSYATNRQQIIEARLYSNFYHDFIPFSNNH